MQLKKNVFAAFTFRHLKYAILLIYFFFQALGNWGTSEAVYSRFPSFSTQAQEDQDYEEDAKVWEDVEAF